MEVVRYKETPVWSTSYGGGMVKGKEELAKQTFSFLKKAMLAKNSNTFSARGPLNLKDGEWEYKYVQDGDIEEFSGYEEIYYQRKLVFFTKLLEELSNDKHVFI